MNTESGFKTLSQQADAVTPDRNDAGGDKSSSGTERFDGAGEMAEGHQDRAAALKRLVVEEIQDRPLRALGWAAAIGFVAGIWISR